MFDIAPCEPNSIEDYRSISIGIANDIVIVQHVEPEFVGISIRRYLEQNKGIMTPIWFHKQDGPRFLAQIGLAFLMNSVVNCGRIKFIASREHSRYGVIVKCDAAMTKIYLGGQREYLYLYHFINTGYQLEAIDELREFLGKERFRGFGAEPPPLVIIPEAGIGKQTRCETCGELVDEEEIISVYEHGECLSCYHNSARARKD